MAKAKSKKDPSRKDAPKKEGAKSKKIAGVKVPKALRKLGPIRDLINSDLGREILADALMAAAGAAAAVLSKSRTGKEAGKAVAEAGSATKTVTQEVLHTATGAVAGVVADAARHFLPPSLVGEDQAESGPSGRKGPAPAGRKTAGTARKAPAAGRRGGTELTDTTGKIPSEE